MDNQIQNKLVQYNNKLNVLQTMRLFASLGVFQYHLWDNYIGIGFLHPGTDFFYLLIGIVAAIAHSRTIPVGRWSQYITARYLRLYVTFIPVFLIYILGGRDELNPVFIVKSFFFIPIHDKLPLVGPTWMLSQFLVFYWLFSLALLFKQEKILIPIFGLWGLSCLLIWWTDLGKSLPSEWRITIFDPRNIEFIMGYLAGKLILQRRINIKAAAQMALLGLVTLILAIVWVNFLYTSSDENIRIFIYGIPLTFFATGLASLEQNGSQNHIFRILLHPWLVWMGGASYVLFLTHNIILRVWDTLFSVSITSVPFILVVVLLTAAIGYQFWEKPVLDFLRPKILSPKNITQQRETV